MQCTNHSQVQATGMCTYCGKPFCQECLVEVKGKMYCKDDIGNVVDEAKESMATSTPTINITNTNTNENTNVNQIGYGIGIPPKSKLIALILCFLFGLIGAHRFYVGKTGTGVLYLFTFGLLGIGAFFDFVMIILGNFKDSFGRPLV